MTTMTTGKRYGPPYPKKVDPVTGVEVLSMTGFFMHEADHHGTTVEEEMDDFARMAEEENASFLAEWSDPKRLLGFARDWLRELNEDERVKTALPRRITEVLDVTGHSWFGGHKVHVKAAAIREHGRRDILHVMDVYYAGTRLDPPDGESEVWWESEHPEA